VTFYTIKFYAYKLIDLIVALVKLIYLINDSSYCHYSSSLSFYVLKYLMPVYLCNFVNDILI